MRCAEARTVSSSSSTKVTCEPLGCNAVQFHARMCATAAPTLPIALYSGRVRIPRWSHGCKFGSDAPWIRTPGDTAQSARHAWRRRRVHAVSFWPRLTTRTLTSTWHRCRSLIVVMSPVDTTCAWAANVADPSWDSSRRVGFPTGSDGTDHSDRFDVGLPGDERASSWPSDAVAQLAESVKFGRLLRSVGVHSL